MSRGPRIAYSPSPAARRTGAIAAIALHAVAVALVLSYQPARSALLDMAPLMVSLLTPPRPEPVPPPPEPKPVVRPKPKPQPKPMPIVAAPVEVPSPSPVIVPPPAPAPAPVEPPSISAAPVPAAPPAAVAAPVAVAPPMITPPVFDADYLDNPAPYYPALARRAGEQGRVVLRVLVNPGGRADQVEIRTSSGHARLDESARDTVRRWRFVPAKRGDEPVPAWVLIPISFRLES